MRLVLRLTAVAGLVGGLFMGGVVVLFLTGFEFPNPIIAFAYVAAGFWWFSIAWAVADIHMSMERTETVVEDLARQFEVVRHASGPSGPAS